jgi:hypothetical protein
MSLTFRNPAVRALLLTVFTAVALRTQTTQGVISGRVLDALFGMPLPGATVAWTRLNSVETGIAYCDVHGLYTLALLSPGTYELRAVAPGFQPQVVAEQKLDVASRIDVTFRLRPAYDVWGNKTDAFLTTGNDRMVHYYAADLRNLETTKVEFLGAATSNLNATVSYLVDKPALDALPLAGRDAYALLVTLPGVTADNGTLRGLGLSVNGQRPTASNFLLDGLENNNNLTTGNLIPVVPEQLQEYRISTSNFSAEYGRTSGFVANAITPAGGSSWHGAAYLFFRNEALNANGVRHPTPGLQNTPLPRLPVKEAEPGLQASGPLGRRSWFGSFALDVLRSASELDPLLFRLPSASFVRSLAPGSNAANLVASLRPPDAGASTQALVKLSPPAERRQYSAIPRIDRELGASRRLFFRVAASHTAFPDFIWSPYRDFISPLAKNAVAVAAALITPGPVANELRAGWNWDRFALDRSRPDIPSLFSFDDNLPDSPFKTLLPGSQAPYAYKRKGGTWQILDNVMWTRYRHTPKAGAGFILRHVDDALDYIPSGYFGFKTLDDFAADQPDHVASTLSRAAFPAQRLPDTSRAYAWRQFYAFLQDSYRLTSRLMIDYGVRYEYFGVPSGVGQQTDARVQLGPGSTFIEKLGKATWVAGANAGRSLYDPDRNNIAPRAGFSWLAKPGARPLLVRGSFGLFYDRPFDNLWLNLRNNDVAYGSANLKDPRPTNYFGLGQVLAGTPLTIVEAFPRLTLIQPGLRDAYVQSYFFGFQQALGGNLTIDAYVSGALGRKLITTDIVNRDYSLPLDQNASDNQYFRFAPGLTQIDYRANQGGSSYNALTLAARYRAGGLNLWAAYSWSHTIDNQTEPLAGDFFNLSFLNTVQSGGAEVQPAQFMRQFDSRGDRGNSDFDQRHTFVIFSFWNVPPAFRSGPLAVLLRDWRLAVIAAIRTGFPFTAYSPVSSDDPIVINRANLTRTGDPLYLHEPVDGGVRFLDTKQFSAPANGAFGNTGRNAFRGPGLYNVDVSAGRSFAWRRLGESGRLAVRADVFNLLNHANLNNPFSVLTSGAFGVALFGRQGIRTGFPGSTPLDETGRQVQLSFRLSF